MLSQASEDGIDIGVRGVSTPEIGEPSSWHSYTRRFWRQLGTSSGRDNKGDLRTVTLVDVAGALFANWLHASKSNFQNLARHKTMSRARAVSAINQKALTQEIAERRQ